MNAMPDPTCPTCGDERAVIMPKHGGKYFLWHCARCESYLAKQVTEDQRKLAEWEAWATARPAGGEG